ncbi:hypothetical protein BD779DRAFT_1570062 [Infundibulicybe gibba]|nr:hypothetical protein BD779DRAFT_1570062 [Infundibulicybe gibba]
MTHIKPPTIPHLPAQAIPQTKMANPLVTSAEAMSSRGPLLIGVLLNSFFFGLLTVQIYIYFSSFPEDRIRTKFLVSGVYLVEIAQTILTFCDVYFVFVTEFGDVAVLERVRTVWIYSFVLAPIVAFAVQVFYAHRIRMLYHSWKLGLVVVILSVTQLVTGQLCAAFIKLQTGLDKEQIFGRISVYTTLACDVTIAMCMALWLLRARRDNRTKRARNIILRLLQLTAENGVILATENIIAITFISYLNLSPLTSSTATKWYSMTLLASLNNRTNTQQMESSLIAPTGIQFRVTTGTQMDVTLLEPPPAMRIRSSVSRHSVQPTRTSLAPE